MNKKHPLWSDKEDDVLRKYYGVLSYKDMLEHLPAYRNSHSIRSRLREIGIQLAPRGKSQFSHPAKCVNDYFFAEMSETNCYWGGFIAADGCIKRGNILKVKLSCRDTPHLLQFKDALQYEGAHTYQTRVNKSGKITYSIEVSIRSLQICTDVFKHFGIGPRKTWILKVPDLPDKLLDAWIVGYIDGDGTVGYYGRKGKQKYLNIIVVGTKSVCEGVRSRFSGVLGENIKNKITCDDGLFRFQISGEKAVVLYKHYKNIQVPKLRRKWSFVPKNWGYELWVANNEKYCGKILYLNKGKRFSYHHHRLKDETFYLMSGKLLLHYAVHDDLINSDIMTLLPGSIFHVPVGLNHQVVASENSELIEFSTTHYDEDSIRIIKGD